MLIIFFTFRRAFKRQCTEDGSWLEGACEPVTCDTPPPIFHDSYHCTDGFRFDSVCKLNCSDPASNSAFAATGGSAHTVRLLHAPCKQVCPSLSCLSILALPICVCLLFVKCMEQKSDILSLSPVFAFSLLIPFRAQQSWINQIINSKHLYLMTGHSGVIVMFVSHIVCLKRIILKIAHTYTNIIMLADKMQHLWLNEALSPIHSLSSF